MRPTIKGKGREIFFPEKDVSKTPSQPYGKVTFWLPVELLEELDNYWLRERAKDKKVTKSGIATQALQEFLKKKGQKS